MKRTFLITGMLLIVSSTAMAQMLRYEQHREVKPPEYATLRLGPFYSDISFGQTAGFRYTRSEGTGTDFLFGNNRGVIKEDGLDYPLVSTLDARNYVMLSRHMDLDISFSVGYALYPKGTQEDEFFFDMAEEGVSGSLSTEFYITTSVRGTISDDILYATDYIDPQGNEDNYGGSAYEHLDNTLALEVDWLMDVDKNMGASVARTDILVFDDEFTDQERVELTEGIYYEQQLAAFLLGGVSISLSQFEYEAETRSDSSLQGYSFYVQARLTDRTSANAALGYNTGRSDDLVDGSTESESASASLSTRLSRELSQAFSFSHGLQGGFSAPFEIYSSLAYELRYENERSSIGFNTVYSSTEPQVDDYNTYDDWITTLDIELPVTRFVGLLFSVEYAARANGDLTNTELTDPQYTSDYETISYRLGTSFSVTQKIHFDIYVQRIDRLSDNPELEYSRDIVAGTFSYSHAF